MLATLAKSLKQDAVSTLRLRKVCAAQPGASVSDVVRAMAEQRTGCTLVLSEGRLLGIFTERDFLSRIVAAGKDSSIAVETVMTAEPKTIRLGASVQDAVELMERGGYRHLPVMDGGGRPVGVLSVKDLVHYLVGYFPADVYNLPPSPDVAQPAREGA